MTDESLDRRVIEAVERHPAVQRVRLVGSRAAGTATAVSDWDFAVETEDFHAVGLDIGYLLAALQPLVQQWDRLSEQQCWMAILPGPVKLDLIFDQPHDDERANGRGELVTSELHKMFEHLLHPMGVETPPTSLDIAVASYLAARDRLERDVGVTVPRALEREVVRALDEQNSGHQSS